MGGDGGLLRRPARKMAPLGRNEQPVSSKQPPPSVRTATAGGRCSLWRGSEQSRVWRREYGYADGLLWRSQYHGSGVGKPRSDFVVGAGERGVRCNSAHRDVSPQPGQSRHCRYESVPDSRREYARVSLFLDGSSDFQRRFYASHRFEREADGRPSSDAAFSAPQASSRGSLPDLRRQEEAAGRRLRLYDATERRGRPNGSSTESHCPRARAQPWNVRDCVGESVPPAVGVGGPARRQQSDGRTTWENATGRFGDEH